MINSFYLTSNGTDKQYLFYTMRKHTDDGQACLRGSWLRFFIASVMWRRCVGIFFHQLALLLSNFIQTLKLREDIVVLRTLLQCTESHQNTI